MIKKYLPTAVLAIFAISAFCAACSSYRNTFVIYQPDSMEQLAGQPLGMTVFKNGKFYIRRKDRPADSR